MSISLGQILRHGQNLLVYPFAFFDNDEPLYTPIDYDKEFEDVRIVTSDKVKIQCYLLLCAETPEKPCRRTAIMFHGNAMNIGQHIPCAMKLMETQCHVLLVSYRGYARSEGKPSEGGIRKDAQAALDYVLKHPILSKTSVIVYGLSLGGAVAIDLVSRNPDKVSALIVENTFLSLPAIVKGWPYIRHVSFLCHQRWDSASKIGKIPRSTPILMLSGLQDQVVLPRHMSSLWDLAQKRGMTKSTSSQSLPPLEYDAFRTFKRGGHSDTFHQKGFWGSVAEFLKGLDRRSSAASSDNATSTESRESESSGGSKQVAVSTPPSDDLTTTPGLTSS